MAQQRNRFSNRLIECLDSLRILFLFGVPIQHHREIDPAIGKINRPCDRTCVGAGVVCVSSLSENAQSQWKRDQVADIAKQKDSSELEQGFLVFKEVPL